MSSIYNKIIKDLSGFNQDNIAPKSFTIKEGDDFRHYELGSVYGVVCFSEGYVMFVDIKEDDGHWFCFNNTDKQYSNAYWIRVKIQLYQRMQKWLEENCEPNYYSEFENQEGFECGFKKLKQNEL